MPPNRGGPPKPPEGDFCFYNPLLIYDKTLPFFLGGVCGRLGMWGMDRMDWMDVGQGVVVGGEQGVFS